MLTGICAGFAEPIGAVRLANIRDRGFKLVRQDLHGDLALRHADAREAVLSEGRAWEAQGGAMLWIVDSTTIDLVPAGSMIEYLNEPEYLTPWQYANLLNYYARDVVKRRGLRLYAGSIGNLDQDSLC